MTDHRDVCGSKRVVADDLLQQTCSKEKHIPVANEVLDCLAVICQAPPREVRRPLQLIIHVNNLKVHLCAKALAHSYIE